MDSISEWMIALSGLAFVATFVFNFVWVIFDLIFASEDVPCLTLMPDGYQMNLSTWLLVDAFSRIGVTTLIFVTTIVIYHIL